MKTFCIVITLAFLVSCWESVVVDTPIQEPTVEEQETVTEIEGALDELIETTQDAEVDEGSAMEPQASDWEEIVLLDATYTNPKGSVDMTIEYELGVNDIIENINVSATTYDLTGFNDSIQSVVGMTLEEASDTYISGSSLTSAAFNNALKKSF